MKRHMIPGSYIFQQNNRKKNLVYYAVIQSLEVYKNNSINRIIKNLSNDKSESESNKKFLLKKVSLTFY